MSDQTTAIVIDKGSGYCKAGRKGWHKLLAMLIYVRPMGTFVDL